MVEPSMRATRAEIQLSAIAHNLATLRKAAGDAQVHPVVKANAYGHGMLEVARFLDQQGVDGLCVALLEEGLALRAAGVKCPVLVMNGVYVLNNPWSVQSNEKHTSYCAMMKLGMPVPKTVFIPPKEYEDSPDLQVTLERYARLFHLEDIGQGLGYPVFMKPYDGGGWIGVSKIDNDEEFHEAEI